MSRVELIPVTRIHTRLASLRGERTAAATTLSTMPIRVAPLPDGSYELVDGFKRLAHWIDHEGRQCVPAVTETAEGPAVKAALLAANAPPKTIGPVDEARVVASLMDEDGYSIAAVAKALDHKKSWVK